MSNKLTESEIKQRLIEGANYKRLYHELKVKSDAKIKALKAENKILKARVTELESIVETQSIQIAELQAYLFGKKRPPHSATPIKKIPPSWLAITPASRTADSYHRSLPSEDEITDTKHHVLPAECSCGGHFGTTTTKTYYEEDIPLPNLTHGCRPKLVTRHIVECGYCNKCGKRQNATWSCPELNTFCSVSLGPNIHLFVSHMISVLGLSYSQVAHLTKVQYNLKLSDGEIAKILARQHHKWLPTYEALKNSIRRSPAKHYDETPWKIAEERMGHAWVMSDARSPDVAFKLASSRGSGHIQELHDGNSPASIRITDGYTAYNNLVGIHQLCWAHLFRVIRDLSTNANLPSTKQQWIAHWYSKFQDIYRDLRAELANPFNEDTRRRVADELWSRVQKLAGSKRRGICDPDKLRRLKAQLMAAGKDKLFACLIYDTPCDNNRAERDLRQLVLKRKRSFGSKTGKGANALSTVMSVCTTVWRRCQDNPGGYYGVLGGV